MHQRLQRAFSLVELLVVLAIIGMLTAIAVPQLLESREKSRVARIDADLQALIKASQALFDDTGEYPGHLAETTCVDGRESKVTDCKLGLYCTDNSYEDWNGPYLLGGEGTDPWGTDYIYDTDYYVDDRIGRVFHTGGPNRSGINVYDDDNTVLFLCSEPYDDDD